MRPVRSLYETSMTPDETSLSWCLVEDSEAEDEALEPEEEDAKKAMQERQEAAYKRKEEEAEVKKLFEELRSGGKNISEEQIAKADFATREKWRADIRSELIQEKEDEKLKKKEKIN